MSIYIYLVPVITVAASVIILAEKVTRLSFIGIVLTLAGLFLSNARIPRKKVAPKEIEESSF